MRACWRRSGKYKYYDDCHHHKKPRGSSTRCSQVSFFGCTDSTVLISEQRDRTQVATRAGADVVQRVAQRKRPRGFWTELGSRGWATWTSKKWELVVTREGGPAGGGKARVPA